MSDLLDLMQKALADLDSPKPETMEPKLFVSSNLYRDLQANPEAHAVLDRLYPNVPVVQTQPLPTPKGVEVLTADWLRPDEAYLVDTVALRKLVTDAYLLPAIPFAVQTETGAEVRMRYEVNLWRASSLLDKHFVHLAGLIDTVVGKVLGKWRQNVRRVKPGRGGRRKRRARRAR
jgi:hypothetical protein